ncbi:MAG: type VI secretion system tip protein VgrG [Deltaproteobacteria bacterium]|nr:type VI secretion system tip protein VgrG [Deltaproteobacteria bacterium]
MAFLTQKKFDFVSQGLDPDTFGVVRFRGSEGFSKCYEFEVDLVSTEAEINLDQVLENPATFTILREEGDIPFHGILAEFEQLHQVDEYVFYRAVLVPKLWWLSLTHHNQVFLEKEVPEIIQDVLKDGDLTSLDFELKLDASYPRWEYVCQYRESHLDFVSRWMEREGMYTYFEQGDQGEKVIIADTKTVHQEMPQGKIMYYSPPSGLDESHREEVVKSFVCRQRMLPKTLKLKDYNYRTPSLDVSGSAEVKSGGRGEVYIYGEHFRTPEEGNALAKIRAEELLCHEKRFYGESTIPYLRPGYLFDLQDHYRGDFNQGYLTIELNHEGSQAAYLIAGIQKGLSEVEEESYYRNTFVAIPGNVQFRPERKTEKARFYGTMNAKIDAAESGKYAELDEQGRYKVLLPFDLSGRKDGKGSTWLRMAQPYAGTDHGMHFPLHKGTEVLLGFIDGDPDRPIIHGAVPNPDMPSPVTSADQSMSKITTAGGNKIHIEDQEGSERLLMHVPGKKTFVRLGAPNDPGHEEVPESASAEWEGCAIATAGALHFKAESKNEFIFGETTEWFGGLKSDFCAGAAFDTTIGEKMDTCAIAHHEFSATKWSYSETDTRIKGLENKLRGVDNTVVESINTLAQSKVQALNLDTRLRDLHTDVTTERTQAIATATSALATKQEVTAAKDEAVATANRAIATASEAIGERVQAVAQRTEAVASKVETLGSHLKTAVESTHNIAVKTNVNAEANTLAALYSVL